MHTEVDGFDVASQILHAARQRLARGGREALDLVTIARAARLDDAAVHQHFRSSDELVSALVLEAYDALGAHVERSVDEARAAGATPLGQWLAVYRGSYAWARKNQARYAVIYGPPGLTDNKITPETLVAAMRTLLVLADILRSADQHQSTRAYPHQSQPSQEMCQILKYFANGALIGFSLESIARLMVAWSHLLGVSGSAVLGHLTAPGHGPDTLLDHTALMIGAYVGVYD